jgi:hypothetical protein
LLLSLPSLVVKEVTEVITIIIFSGDHEEGS